MVSSTNVVPVDLDILYVSRVSCQSLKQRDGGILHFLPCRHIRVRRVEIHPSARSIDSWVVLPRKVDPALFRVPRLGAWVTDHLTNRPERYWNPSRVLVGSNRVQ